MYTLLALFFALLPGNNSVFVTADNGTMLSVVHEQQYDSIEFRRVCVDSATGVQSWEGLPDIALAYATGAVYVQVAWWFPNVDANGQTYSNQDFDHYVLWE